MSHHFSSRAPCGLLCTLLYLLGSGFGVAEEILQQRKGKTNKYIFCLVLNFSQKQPLSFHHFRSSLSGPSYASDANWQKKGERVGKRSLTAPRSFSFSFSFAFVRGKSSVGRQLAQGERKEKRTQVDTSGPRHILESTHQFLNPDFFQNFFCSRLARKVATGALLFANVKIVPFLVKKVASVFWYFTSLYVSFFFLLLFFFFIASPHLSPSVLGAKGGGREGRRESFLFETDL